VLVLLGGVLARDSGPVPALDAFALEPPIRPMPVLPPPLAAFALTPGPLPPPD